MLNSYPYLKFEFIKRTDKSGYANGNDLRLVNLGPIALFSNFKSKTSSGKHLESITHAHIVSLIYKLISNAKDSDDLSVGFDRDRNSGREELTINKIEKGKLHVRILLKDVFGFAEHQEKSTYSVG